MKGTVSTPSLIGSCRAARIREDSSIFLLQDSFRIRSLLTKSQETTTRIWKTSARIDGAQKNPKDRLCSSPPHLNEEAQKKQVQPSKSSIMWTSSSIPIENYNLTRKKAYLAVTAKIGAVSSTTSDPVHENQTQKSIKDLLYNGTGYYIEDEGESGLSDIQTVFLACIATLIPLTAILMTAFGISLVLLWRRYKKHNESQQYDGIIHGEETSESVTRPLHSHLLTDKTFIHKHTTT
ncbi:hypothetical protein NQ317_005653 [Molorchus minor]|uniref:Uncharacterized protein n=1 Tax=Molorchus minor TaxID=1323400 RepID=A0ABQ9K787_9CUCU|nr:hypothetical protein NQ317_005653 [Molorchus minor]